MPLSNCSNLTGQVRSASEARSLSRQSLAHSRSSAFAGFFGFDCFGASPFRWRNFFASAPTMEPVSSAAGLWLTISVQHSTRCSLGTAASKGLIWHSLTGSQSPIGDWVASSSAMKPPVSKSLYP